MSDKICITVISSLNDQTETINLPSQSTTISNLKEFAVALLGIPPENRNELVKDGRPIVASESSTLALAGLKSGDVILVVSTTARATRPAAPAPAPLSSVGGGGGGLDFSSLLGNSNSGASARTTASGVAAGTGALSFHIPGLEAAAASQSLSTQKKTVSWAGMSLDDAIAENPNPAMLIPLLFSAEHPMLMKELNYHSPDLAKKLREAGSEQRRVTVWREEMMRGGIKRALAKTTLQKTELDMRNKLKVNPMDEEANNYFGEKIKKENVEAQYRQMMEEYPESLSKILMLYIPIEVNATPIEAFVDSGAQSTIMSQKIAEKCNILHLLDTRFAGTAVGVGTGKILGRVHLTPIKIKNHFFPCTITVLESDGVDFLFGLDMLKRHRCRMDLHRGVLGLKLDSGYLEIDFLHEKDLEEGKGGTQGFDADKSNQEYQERMDNADKEGQDHMEE
eukprot:CAMPEP_0172486774 /NCGR_PEP_ID=MMETSP1066-20121228/15499_1 /TAXON_ID=671091 /ORGANISM="Coscinodiscus wailesii, Strain CCMP2513" /LENGTH=450 /DNA_ID=CAMNT_0013252941 /DNA_START=72 /DNA_END=1424 /DNA_ORIENTATION=-